MILLSRVKNTNYTKKIKFMISKKSLFNLYINVNKITYMTEYLFVCDITYENIFLHYWDIRGKKVSKYHLKIKYFFGQDKAGQFLLHSPNTRSINVFFAVHATVSGKKTSAPYDIKWVRNA